MKKHYVKVVNGVIVDGPHLISQSESAFPNTNWGDDQMKIHGFVRVDLDHDKNTEQIDYSSPIISGDTVVYPRIPANLKDSKLKASTKVKLHAENLIQSKYSAQEQFYAVVLGQQDVLMNIEAVYLVLEKALADIESASSINQLNSITPDWPTL